MTSGSLSSAADDGLSSVNAAPDENQIMTDLLEIIRKHTKSSGEDWNGATTLEDVGIDSFDLVEMVFEIEEKYDISVNFNANTTADDFTTVADVVGVIGRAIASKRRGDAAGSEAGRSA